MHAFWEKDIINWNIFNRKKVKKDLMVYGKWIQRKGMNRLFFFVVAFFFSVSGVGAEEEWNTGNIRLKHEYQHFVLKNAGQFVETGAQKLIPTEPFCYDAELEQSTEESEKTQTQASHKTVNTEAIQEYLREYIAKKIDQEVHHVTISKDENGKIVFDGYAQEGVMLDLEESAELIASAITNNIHYVTLKVEKVSPIITVNDEDLKQKGIQELVSVGRSDFSGSSWKRIHNVMTGASKFNGYLLPKGEVFSFTDQLGAINGATGYVKELVILGNKVLPEYGGGLCQVSSTAYRAAMLAGMEIVERHNHSYAVSYYEPFGSDATIYSGHKDFRFQNTSDGDILIQTRRGGHNNQELFFHYYGTKPNRSVQIFGPLITNYRTPPATKITYDSTKPTGYSQTVSHRVTGFNAQFFRTVTEEGESLYSDEFFSPYQARGTWIIRGGAEE